MEVEKIIESKENLLEFLKEKGFEDEKDYSDEDYKEGIYFKIGKRKLLVVYEIVDEEKLKEIKDHFLIDRGLSYCIIVFNNKLIFIELLEKQNTLFILKELKLMSQRKTN